MKKSISSSLKIFLVFLCTVTLMPVNRASAQGKSDPVIIGTYDSRAVVFAYSRSAFFREYMTKFKQQSDSAEKAHDTARVKELTIQIISYQHLLHQMIFGPGSTAAITDLVREKLPEVAKKAGVVMLVSKFELTYKDPSVEVIDLTGEVIKLFQPTENINEMVGEIAKAEPVPLQDLTIETEMLDGYCKRFGK